MGKYITVIVAIRPWTLKKQMEKHLKNNKNKDYRIDKARMILENKSEKIFFITPEMYLMQAIRPNCIRILDTVDDEFITECKERRCKIIYRGEVIA